MNALARIQDNLATVGLTIARRHHPARVPRQRAGAPAMDVNGFNRAYRQFFANVNLHTGATLLQPRGDRAPLPRRSSSTRSAPPAPSSKSRAFRSLRGSSRSRPWPSARQVAIETTTDRR